MRLAALISTALVLTACATGGGAPTSVPLPPNAKVTPPAPDTNADRAQFSGKWTGIWDGALPHVLVVEEISGNGAVAIYAWGDSAQWNMRGGNARARGTFSDNSTLVVKLPRPATVTYQMKPNGTIDGTYEYSGGMARATLTKMTE